MHKKEHGQFFTESNPFSLRPFRDWFIMLPEHARLLEPFAGSNNLIEMVDNTFGKMEWGSFDIEPPKENAAPYIKTEQLDTIKNMPEGYDAIITNPPYLARNSATRSGIKFAKSNRYDDLYKFCLEKMLEKYDFVAAIIPESFITSGQFRRKLYTVVSLTQNMFKDTDCPVCIAMFVPASVKDSEMEPNDFLLYQLDKKIGLYSRIDKYYSKLKQQIKTKVRYHFNDRDGLIGLRGVDNTVCDSIKFVPGEEISPERIKNTSRAVTRISVDVSLSDENLQEVIRNANLVLQDFRKNTNDVFMTSFKGLREDGKYRRRLDYRTASEILDIAFSQSEITKAEQRDYQDLPIFSLRYA